MMFKNHCVDNSKAMAFTTVVSTCTDSIGVHVKLLTKNHIHKS